MNTAFNKIFIIYKISALQRLQQSKDYPLNFKKLPQDKQASLELSHANQVEFLASLQATLQNLQIDATYINECDSKTIQITKNDLLISCGGDGMFLACAQKYPSAFLLGMNSDYRTSPASGGSYGALTKINKYNLEKKLTQLLENKYTISYWRRLQASVNEQPIAKLAVNDIFYGQELSYTMCQLRIYFQNLVQDIQCSGIITSTAMGSHAWYYNAGGVPFDNHLSLFAFSIFCPNRKRKYLFDSGILSDNDKVTIIPAKDNYILCFDSKSNVVTTKMADTITISLASKEKSLKVISF